MLCSRQWKMCHHESSTVLRGLILKADLGRKAKTNALNWHKVWKILCRVALFTAQRHKETLTEQDMFIA